MLWRNLHHQCQAVHRYHGSGTWLEWTGRMQLIHRYTSTSSRIISPSRSNRSLDPSPVYPVVSLCTDYEPPTPTSHCSSPTRSSMIIPRTESIPCISRICFIWVKTDILPPWCSSISQHTRRSLFGMRMLRLSRLTRLRYCYRSVVDGSIRRSTIWPNWFSWTNCAVSAVSR
jgi:hypothetical protein